MPRTNTHSHARRAIFYHNILALFNKSNGTAEDGPQKSTGDSDATQVCTFKVTIGGKVLEHEIECLGS